MSYVDTSVIVAALDTSDSRWKKARKLLEITDYKIVSELALVELASVISRRRELVSNIAKKLRLREDLTIIVILLYTLKRFKISHVSVEGYVKLPLLNKVSLPVSSAIELSSRLKLKTLDLLHISYMKLLKEKGVPIRVFITVDKDFEKIKRELNNMNVRLRLIE